MTKFIDFYRFWGGPGTPPENPKIIEKIDFSGFRGGSRPPRGVIFVSHKNREFIDFWGGGGGQTPPKTDFRSIFVIFGVFGGVPGPPQNYRFLSIFVIFGGGLTPPKFNKIMVFGGGFDPPHFIIFRGVRDPPKSIEI